MDFVSVEKKVKTILEGFPTTRNSDKLLLAQYCRVYHNIESLADWAASEETPPAETITRARRKIQAAGLFLPTNAEVVKRRKQAEQEARDYARA